MFGDTKGHDSLYELIDYYQTNAIQPFEESLASSCFEVRQNSSVTFFKSHLMENEDLTGVLFLQELDKELYDTIQVSPKERPVGAIKNMRTPKINSEQLPALPPRTQEVSTVLL